ncbi:MAG TPA: DUF3303 family protein [Planctomycetota bacterium]|nr:DUF3303 family protein [Planctomycetota bacterium]
MLYMVIERWPPGAAPAIYRRFRERGRMAPEGLEDVASWVDHDVRTCWQLMRAEDPALFRAWTDDWKDLGQFEIVPVRTSAEAAEIMRRGG